jgi:hypothetical protein
MGSLKLMGDASCAAARLPARSCQWAGHAGCTKLIPDAPGQHKRRHMTPDAPCAPNTPDAPSVNTPDEPVHLDKPDAPNTYENFLGLNYCDNSHNIVTIHRMFILCNEMNKNKTINNKPINNKQQHKKFIKKPNENNEQ